MVWPVDDDFSKVIEINEIWARLEATKKRRLIETIHYLQLKFDSKRQSVGDRHFVIRVVAVFRSRPGNRREAAYV
jgi:hypothetical protein